MNLLMRESRFLYPCRIIIFIMAGVVGNFNNFFRRISVLNHFMSTSMDINDLLVVYAEET